VATKKNTKSVVSQRAGGRGLMPWLGGKSQLADRIIPLIPPHRCYVEVFAGAAWLLFRKPESSVEVLNDINVELVTLYRVVKHHLDEFIRYLRWLLNAREEFARFKASDPATLTDVQRAVRFYYLHRSAFTPGVASPTWRCSDHHRPSFNLLRIEEHLSAAHVRLAGVYVENRPYAEVLSRFDKPSTFFYLDPPYYGSEADYGRGLFSRADYARLRGVLESLKGKFILSLNDRREVRRIYRGFAMRSVQVRYHVGGVDQAARELLIANYALRP